jgi:thiol-disulfide isomerase/thioredoxin
MIFLIPILSNCSSDQDSDIKIDHENISEDLQGEIRKLTPRMLDELIRNRNGKVLLINVWATWCIPCREEFPDLVKLAEKYQERNLEIIGISADYPDEIVTKIRPFIESEQVNFPIYVQNFDKQENFINYFNEDWMGALPATFIYDTSGTQQVFLLGKRSYKEFRQTVEKFL